MQGARLPKFKRASRGGRKLVAALLCGLFLRMLLATALFVQRPVFRGQKPSRTRRPAAASSDESRDAAFMERLQGLAREALAWPFLEDAQRLVWAAVLEFDAVPTPELPPWFFERHNFTRRRVGVDLFSLDGQQAILCRAGNSTGKDVKRFLRTANCVLEAPCCTLWTDRGCNVSADSQRWLREYGGQRKILTKKRLRQLCCDTATSVLTSGQALAEQLSDPPLRPCQEACLEACAKGARVIEMACGTGKTRVIRELATKQTGKVLVTVPSRVLLEQFAEELPGFCRVGTGYNSKIDFSSRGYISVTDSVQLLENLEFEAIYIDEAHHPLPQGFPSCRDIFKFSATHQEQVDFRYSLGEAIEQGVLSDYDLTVPVTTEAHPYICLANLLLSQAGRFRRVLAYCNSIAEAKRFRQVLETVGLAAWHIIGKNSSKERERVMKEFSGDLQTPVHVLVTVQVLGEGVNIPNADTCMFVEPRSSYVSIIQAMGRVLRPHLSKPLAHIVLPAIALPATTNRAAMAPPGLSHLAGGTQSMLRTSGSEEHVLSSEEAMLPKARRAEPPQNELLASGDGPQTALLLADGCADCRVDSISPTQRPEVGLKDRSQGSNANRPRPCDPRSHNKTPTTGDHQGAELGRPERLEPSIPIETVSNEDALIVPIESAAAAPAVGDRQGGERVLPRSPASLTQEDGSDSFTAPVPAGTIAGSASALAAGEVTQRKASRNAAARGRSAARRQSAPARRNQENSGGGHPTARLRAQGRRDYYPLSEQFAECSANKAECSGSSSQSAASMTDAHQHSGLRTIPAWRTSAGTFAEQEPAGPARKLSVAAPAQVAHTPILMASQGTGAGLSAKEYPGKLMCRRASKLKVKTADGAHLFGIGSGRADQLERFLEVISQADSRFANKDVRLLQSRLWVMDCRLQQPIMQQLLARDVQYQLALILQQPDAFDLRLQAVEKFDREHGRLPRQQSNQLEERTLGLWLHNVGYRQKQQKLPAERMQKLVNSSCSRLRGRATQWLEPDASFKAWLEGLRQFVRAHHRMPSAGKRRPMAERQLRLSLLDLVNPSNGKNQRRLQLLEKADPIVSDWVKTRRTRKLRVQKAQWNRQFDRLRDFVEVHGRLPQSRLEGRLYDWICRQRRQLNYLPAELRAKLVDSHPVISALLQS
ncbi:unnamed protein product [Symbiodinium sp. CCMP2456]|nr:unnamed protein product [Symbiodinium sp. CCMP2456]